MPDIPQEATAGAANLPLEHPAVKLLDEALFLRMNGERPPGSPDATWRRFDEAAELYLRGLLPPDPEDVNAVAGTREDGERG